MLSTLRVAAVGVLLLAGVTACGDDEPEGPASSGAEAACLVTADQLREITGTAQEIREVDVPGGGLGTELSCETVVDEREVSMEWFFQEPSIDPPPTHEEQRSLVEGPNVKVEETDLGHGQQGWVAAGKPVGRVAAEVVTLVDDLMLYVSVTAGDDDAAVSVPQIRDEALALASAVVAARAE